MPDELIPAQILAVLNKAIHRFSEGEVAHVTSSRNVYFGYFAGETAEESLEYSLDCRVEPRTLRVYSPHHKLSVVIEKKGAHKETFATLERIMLNVFTSGVNVGSSKAYRDFFKKIM